MSVATIERWEQGKSVPQAQTFACVLDALNILRQERAAAMSLLDRVGALKLTKLKPVEEEDLLCNQEEEATDWEPYAGQCWKAMRMRHGLTATEVAREVGCDKSTITRVEQGFISVSDVGLRERLFDCYNAYPEERQALTCCKTRLTNFAVSEFSTLDECTDEFDRIYAANMRNERFLADLNFLMLEASLANFARRDEKALRLLITTWIHHAGYLLWQQRTQDIRRYIKLALSVGESRFPKKNFWLDAVNIGAQHLNSPDVDSPGNALALLKKYEDYARSNREHINLYRDKACYMARIGNIGGAEHHLGKSRGLAQQQDQAWGIRLANIGQSILYLDIGEPQKALPFLAQDTDFDSNGHFNEIRQWVRTCRALNDVSGAREWIRKGDELLTIHNLEFRRADWEKLKQAEYSLFPLLFACIRVYSRLTSSSPRRKRSHFYNLKVAAFDALQRAEFVVVPAWVGSARHKPIAAVVRHDHAVSLQAFQNHLTGSGKARNVHTGFQADAHAHRRQVRIGFGTGEMKGGRNIGMAAAHNRKSQRMAYLFPQNSFIVAHKTGKYGQSGGIRARPSGRTGRIGFQVEDRAAARFPAVFAAAALRIRAEQFVQFLVIAVHNQNMTVALSIRPAFNLRPDGDRIRAGVAFVFILEGDGNARRVAGNNNIGNPARRAIVHRAEIGMQGLAAPDTGNQRVRVGINWRFVYGRIPRIRSGEGTIRLQIGIDAQFRLCSLSGPCGNYKQKKGNTQVAPLS